jgi:hypothetical protein
MQIFISLLVLITGLLIRLAIPIALTALLIFLLRKLDAHWQTEAQLHQPAAHNIECWKIKRCTPEKRRNCIALNSSLPCWQAQRLPNGYLREECLSCKVFIEAPMPVLQAEPRRM